jgi:glucosyl-3-phosphoglycerate synthase
MADPSEEFRENRRCHQDLGGSARACWAPAERWARERTFHHSLYTAERIARERTASVSVCLPAKECAGTIGAIVEALAKLKAKGAIDELVVVDAASRDGTAAVAERAGATVYQEAELLPRYGDVVGKGDAMWRALSVLAGEVVCYLDADIDGFSAHFATGLVGPLVCEGGVEPGEGGVGLGEGGVEFVKAFYRRPFEQGGVTLPEGGGRVNHLMARPALELFYPELAAVRQPLAGEVAARRELLERVPFVTGYGVEVGMLIDVWREVGLGGMAQVDLEVHHNRHQPLRELTPMAYTVLATIARRLEREGRLHGVEGARVSELAAPASTGTVAGGMEAWTRPAGGAIGPCERPPMASVGAR